MHTPTKPLKWNASSSREVHAIARPKWKELRQGLVLALLGEVLFLLLGCLALAAVAPPVEMIAWRMGVDGDAVLLAACGLGVGALLGYVLLVAGQWRCLVYAPQGHGAKELQFAGLLCALGAPVCLATAHYLGGAKTYAALARGLDALADLDPVRDGVPLQVAGLLLGLGAVLLFSAFARSVVRCLREEQSARRAGYYFWFVAFVFGGSAGVFLGARRAFGQEAVVAIGLAWLLCLLWHAALIRNAGRLVANTLARQGSRQVHSLPPAAQERGEVILQVASYLRSAN